MGLEKTAGRLGLAAEHSPAPRGFRRGALPGAPRLVGLLTAIAFTFGFANIPVAAASAAAVADAPTVGTWFDGLGSPYGGCGVPQDLLETQDFVALNVYNTPGEYSKSPLRPLTGADLAIMGAFENGLNCGRWMEVTVGPICTGTNDGAPNQTFCRGAGAQWVEDEYSGATLDMIVADSCGDGNAWCRDSKLHIDLSKASLARFKKNGALVPNLEPAHWNNRQVSWKYKAAPAYTGDIRVYFLKDTQKYYSPIMVTHLPNGVHAVEQLVAGAWKRAEPFKDMGQGFILTSGDVFRIRLIDADDKPVFDSREYQFSPPAACGSAGGICSANTTPITYQSFPGGGSALRPAAEASADLRVSLHALPHALAVTFQASASGAWTVSALDARGRVAASSLGNAQVSQPCRVELPGLARGVYSLRFQSGSVRLAGKTIAIP
jgi:hypothetical protein